ncbi:unnamed protein product [Vicia faba]|uniref:VIN3-like protein 1 n=1 Tax=Vicia faba TaxID=3906 RepID=A0AAV1BB35_VICFA|nr:unnamed protein product [Vicia faba]
MDLEDKFLVKVSGVQSLSSSVQSTPEKNGHSDDASRSSELLQEFMKHGPKKELLQTCFDKDKKNTSSKNRMTEGKSSGKDSDFGHPSTWICKNAACRAVLSMDDTFCRRCSCCICHLFDDNKDPSLWLVCTSESTLGDSCELSCHIECALQHEKVGVVDHGQLMQLDGGYCCASCGKVTGILGCWKKQLNIAKDARRVDVLCYRIYMSYRLLNGTSKFKDLHQMVQEAKAKLETEVGPLDGVSAKMARGIVSRLPIASDVQRLCTLAIEKADSWLATAPNLNPEGSLPAPCKFVFEESRDEPHTKDPVSVFPKSQRRILISDLQPCTEYTFRIVSYTDMGDLGHSEAKCFTKSIEIIQHKISKSVASNHKKLNSQAGGDFSTITGPRFKVQDLGKILRLAWAQERGYFEECCSADVKNCCGQGEMNKPKISETWFPSDSRGLDLNVVSVPDLNEDLTPPFESSRDEGIGCTLLQAVEAIDDAASHDLQKNDLARSHRSGDSQTWAHGPREVSAVDSRVYAAGRKRSASTNEEGHDCDSTLINGSPLRMPDSSRSLDENFEYCVKVIRWLECEGHIKQEFRLKLLTWFSLRSTEQERRVVNTFIQTLMDDPSSLAGQLVDSFSDIVSSKRPRNGFSSKAGASK